jgi:predicted nucleic acid-binding protein
VITADTNLFVYLWDNADPGKRQVAQVATAYIAGRGGPIGLQVIGELQNSLRRKMRQSASEAAQHAQDILTTFDIFAASETNAEESLALMAVGRLSYWDALLITAARDAGCRVMLSEDMHDGARFGDLEILNPFGPAGPSDRLKVLLSA